MAYVLGRLERELSPDLHYHSLGHTRDDVLPAAMRLADLSQVSEHETLLLATGALFHDLGFIERRNGHEEISARIAAEVLPGFGFAPSDVAVVAGLIAATRLPQSPRTPLEQLMADADLDILGRDDFFAINAALRRELERAGGRVTDETWYEAQMRFLRAHRYFSPAAATLRDAGKAANIAEMASRLARLRGRGSPRGSE
jgi:uncharacterized protein